MSDTPETDAAEWSWYEDCTPENEMIVPSKFARKLERERDEARELHRNALREREATEKEVDATLERAQKAERERDEAREAFAIATDQMVIAQGKLREANKERDEAREQNAKLRDIAERAIDDLRWFYESKADGIILELDQLKEGEK
jgi:hypothetical protein